MDKDATARELHEVRVHHAQSLRIVGSNARCARVRDRSARVRRGSGVRPCVARVVRPELLVEVIFNVVCSEYATVGANMRKCK